MVWARRVLPSSPIVWDRGSTIQLKTTSMILLWPINIRTRPGYLDSDGDGVRETPDGAQPLIFRLNWEGEAGEPDTMGDLLSETWGQIGIQLEPEALDFDSLVAVCCPSFDFDLILWGWGSDLDPGFLLSVMTTDAIATGMSETGYSNPEYDALFAEQAVTLDPEKRRQIGLAYARDCPQRHRLPRAPLC